MDTKTLSLLNYGMYLVASKYQDFKSGFIANSLFQISSQPQLLAVSCSKKNLNTEIIFNVNRFAFTVLAETTPFEFIQWFGFNSGKQINKFQNYKIESGNNNSIIFLENAIAYFECKVEQFVELGSHVLFIASVDNATVLKDNMKAMTYDYYRNYLKGTTPANAPTAEVIVEKNPDMQDGELWLCPTCGYVYDAAKGDATQNIKKGILFGDLPEEWVCPVCKAKKDIFIPYK